MAPEDFYVFGFDRAADDELQLCWLTRKEAGSHSIPRTALPSVTLRELRDDHRRINLATVWPRPLVTALERQLSACGGSRPARIRLCVQPPLGSAPGQAATLGWERLPIEYLYVAGTRLRDLATVERAVPRLPDGAPATRGKVLLLNRWFAREGQDAGWQLPAPDASSGLKVCDGADVDPFLYKHHDLTDRAALFLIAHGDRPLGQRVTVSSTQFWVRSRPGAQEEPWNPLQHRALPALVGVLACADDDYRLVEYGRSLLSDSTRCVLVPVGKIDAEQATLFAASFARTWKAGVTVHDALRAVAAERSPDDSMRKGLLDRLWVLGDADLRREDSQRAASARRVPLQAQPAAELRHHGRRSVRARAVLLDRATQCALGRTGTLHAAVRETVGLLDVDPTYDAEGRRLMRQLDTAYSYVAPVTQHWLAQYLVGLGERYKHSLMQRYQALSQGEPALSFGIPLFVGARCAACARNGEFEEGAAHLARGFDALQRLGSIPLDRFELAGVLVNYLIDFNLPALAVDVCQQVDREAARLFDDLDVRYFRFTLLDRWARAVFRAGDTQHGFELMRRKYQQARARGEDGGRELAWLIYLAAWSGSEAKRVCRDLDLLTPAIAAVEAAIDPGRRRRRAEMLGNDNDAYLLRALAAWHWSTVPSARLRSPVGELLDRAWPSVSWHLSRRDDPGPFGLAVGYLAAAGQGAAQGAWFRARGRLLASRYDVETVGVSLLQGCIDQRVMRALTDFQRTRAAVVSQLESVLTSDLPSLPLEAVRKALESRGADECRLLENGKGLRGRMLHARLIETGLVPL